jgi:hypothetical protein
MTTLLSGWSLLRSLDQTSSRQALCEDNDLPHSRKANFVEANYDPTPFWMESIARLRTHGRLSPLPLRIAG